MHLQTNGDPMAPIDRVPALGSLVLARGERAAREGGCASWEWQQSTGYGPMDGYYLVLVQVITEYGVLHTVLFEVTMML